MVERFCVAPVARQPDGFYSPQNAPLEHGDVNSFIWSMVCAALGWHYIDILDTLSCDRAEAVIPPVLLNLDVANFLLLRI